METGTGLGLGVGVGEVAGMGLHLEQICNGVYQIPILHPPPVFSGRRRAVNKHGFRKDGSKHLGKAQPCFFRCDPLVSQTLCPPSQHQG